METKRRTLHEELIANTKAHGLVDECLLWGRSLDGNGYGKVWVIDGGRKLRGVHRLACEIHHGPPPGPRSEAAHACRNTNCYAGGHLRWATRVENLADRLRDGTDPNGENHGLCRLSTADVWDIRSLYATGLYTQERLGGIYGVQRSHISGIVNFKQRKIS